MVIRVFRVTPKADRLKEYEQLLIDTVLPTTRKAKGCRGAQALKSLGVVREIVVITLWDNLDSVRAFAGENWHNPVLIGNEAEMVESAPDVKHYHQIADF
jgi:quinol monooxygenase YgiN